MNDFWTAFSALAAIFTIVGGAYAFGKNNGYRQATLALNNERESKRFVEIYAPLMGLFTTCHITTVSARGAPYLRQRIRNSIECLLDRKPLQALKALVDKQDQGVSGEVEYGGTFPLPEITQRLKGRERFADQELVNLVARANRAQYEDQPSDSDLTDADILLFNHICREHEKLVRRFVGA
ncbi:hypothetical protein J5J83_03095 [Azoarcus sp. L1K30]|uniref:hypothetical protein n=1 Tax=Azoarcus sp. L1K30 TaxID=2820277 RepID=UPI001B82334A|nr:hypothetical protein [Azoarcus sp. L1K30]MBR0565102.1 hypothetical protein [Azoarcus sp. L1K30]